MNRRPRRPSVRVSFGTGGTRVSVGSSRNRGYGYRRPGLFNLMARGLILGSILKQTQNASNTEIVSLRNKASKRSGILCFIGFAGLFGSVLLLITQSSDGLSIPFIIASIVFFIIFCLGIGACQEARMIGSNSNNFNEQQNNMNTQNNINTQQNSTKKCAYCQSNNAANTTFCVNCGAQL